MEKIKKYPRGQRLSAEELASWLIANYPIMDIAYTAANYLIDAEDDNRIIVTMEQFRRCFRIRGYQPDGTQENRGRKPLSERLLEAKQRRDDRTERIRMIDNDTKDTGED